MNGASLTAIMFGEVQPARLSCFEKAARKTNQPQGIDGRFVPTTLGGAVKEFTPLIGRNLVNAEKGFSWNVTKADFVKLLFGKIDDKKPKAMCYTPKQQIEFYNALAEGKKWPHEIGGFESDRVRLIKFIPSIFEHPDVLAVGAEGRDKGTVIFVKKLHFPSVTVLMEIPLKKHQRGKFLGEAKDMELTPISHYLKEDEPIKEYMKRFKPIGGDPKKRHLYYDDNNK